MSLFGPSDYHILADEVVQREDLPKLIEKATMAVLDRYTEAMADGLSVRLRGYDEDPEECDEELLVRLKYVIGDVLEHWHTMPDPGVSSVQRGERSVTFKSVIATMPKQAFALLAPFDLREPLWRI